MEFPLNQTRRSLSYVFLCVVPLLAVALTTVRALRVPGLYQTIGAVHFAAICLAGWNLGARAVHAGPDEKRRLALSGALLLTPFALISLLWVGLVTPWEATQPENRMRYLVLLAGSMAVAGGFIVLKDVLNEAGERFYSTVGFAANIFAGAAYLVWLAYQIGIYALKVRDGSVSPMIVSMSDVYDILLFIACVLTYLTVAAFAASLGRMGWLGRGATRAFVIANVVALLLILIRGLSFPDPNAGATPWYTHPGFIAGIPAVPWIMPYLIGVALLRRAGDESL